jgi:alpha-D-xyloside xylohydrolase
MWLPPTVSTVVNLTGGEHQIQLSCKATNNPEVSWKLADNLTTFRSPNAKLLDYVVFMAADDVIAAYRIFRESDASVMGIWILGVGTLQFG